MDSNEHRDYEGYGYYTTSSGTTASADPYADPWDSGKPSAGGATGMSGGAGGAQRGKHSESPDSIITKINQRLDLLSKDSGDKGSQECSFSFEAFESYMAPNSEPFRYSEETGGASEGGAELAPQQPAENHSLSRPAKGGGGRRGQGGGTGGNKNKGGGNRGGGRGGFAPQGRPQSRRSGGGGAGGGGGGGGGGGYYHHREGPPPPHYHPHYAPPPDPYMRYGMPPPPPHPVSSSERLSARWNELNYMGPHPGMGPRGGHGRLPSLFSPSGRHLAPPEYHGMPGPPHHHHHPPHPPLPPHGMMGARYPPFPPYGPPGGPGPWPRPGRKRTRSERESRKARSGAKNTDGKKKCRQTESEGEESEHREEEDDNGDGELEEGAGEDVEKKPSVGGEEEEGEEEPKKKSRGRRSKEKQQKERSKMLFACSLCKYRTADEAEINGHLESRLHQDIIDFLESKMPEGTAKFLQEYTVYRNKKILKKRQEVFEKDGRPQKADPFRDLAQDEFCRRIEAAHCMACDMVIPGQRHLLQQHLASKEHQRNRQAITDQFKMSSVQIAKSILSNKNISDMMEKHLRGEDPFSEEAEEAQEQSAAPASEGAGEGEGVSEGGAAIVAQTSAEDILLGGGAEGNGEGEGEGEVGGEEEEGFSEDDLEEEEEDEDEENPMA